MYIKIFIHYILRGKYHICVISTCHWNSCTTTKSMSNIKLIKKLVSPVHQGASYQVSTWQSPQWGFPSFQPGVTLVGWGPHRSGWPETKLIILVPQIEDNSSIFLVFPFDKSCAKTHLQFLREMLSFVRKFSPILQELRWSRP